MEKPVDKKINDAFSTEGLIEAIQHGYIANRGPKHQQKKTFAPSTIAYGHGECARYWYLAFDGGTFDWEGEELLGEIKTMMNEGFEYRKLNRKPKPGHLIQLLIYMKILQKRKAVLIYENKNNHELLVLPVEINDYYIKWVNEAFDWMRDVRKAWTDRTMPEKNYRSNSKICKNCPLSKVCADAGKGDIKINRLEPIDENMSMV